VSFETETPDETADLAALRDMLAIRAKLIQRGIMLCTIAAITICGLIGMMFIDALLDRSLARAIAMVFVAAMLTIMTGLIYFLREVLIATASLRSRHIRSGDPKVRNAV
jgi:ABC-type multidrug transport system fused ATPase/permease subunit